MSPSSSKLRATSGCAGCWRVRRTAPHGWIRGRRPRIGISKTSCLIIAPIWWPRDSEISERLRGSLETNRHVLDAAIEVGPQPLNRSSQFDVGHAADNLLEHHPHFEPRESRPDAEMAAVAERQMIVRRTIDVEPVRIGKDLFVAIGR